MDESLTCVVLNFSTSLQSSAQSKLHVCMSLSHAAGPALLTHGTQSTPKQAVNAALDLAIRAFEHGPTRLHQTVYETAVMAMTVAMHSIHSTLSTPGPLHPSTPPPRD